jgi:hypothetical protein
VVRLVEEEIRPAYMGVKKEGRKPSVGGSYSAKVLLDEVEERTLS